MHMDIHFLKYYNLVHSFPLNMDLYYNVTNLNLDNYRFYREFPFDKNYNNIEYYNIKKKLNNKNNRNIIYKYKYLINS